MDKAKQRVGYVVSNELAKVSSLLPSNKNRSVLVHTLIKQYGMLTSGWSDAADICVYAPKPAEVKDLTAYHDKDYVDFILDAKASDRNAEYGIEEDCPPFPGLAAYVRLIAGASLTAANLLLNDRADVAICWDGGRHHAQKAQASGFCYVADCVLAILALRRSRIPLIGGDARKARIMYLDLDLHFSDGVSGAFVGSTSGTSSPQILTLSLHYSAPGFFPASPLADLSDSNDPALDPFSLSLPLMQGASDATFAAVWKSVEAVKEAFTPDFVVVQCGTDGLAGDPCGIWNWSLGTSDGSFGRYVDKICNQWGCKVLLLGGGGYNSPNAARAWAYLTSIALRKPLALDTDIPDHAAFLRYAPSFTLDVPAGTIQDQNTEKYLSEIDDRFARIVDILRQRMTQESS